MAAYKDEARGTWYVSFHYNDWTGKNKRKLKRGFRTRKEALEYEQKFLLQQATNLDMRFADFYKLYEEDLKPKLKLNTWRTKEVRYPNREYFFLNTKGKKITSSSALATIQEKLEEVNNINTTTLALKGVSKLIQKGLTLSEIKYLTGFETKKIEDVSRWLMNQEDVESVINNKLNLIDI